MQGALRQNLPARAMKVHLHGAGADAALNLAPAPASGSRAAGKTKQQKRLWNKYLQKTIRPEQRQ
ncbi:MAG: hypothetical protein ACJ8G3_00445 [Burkholderiaceae bacterium]